MRVRDKGVIDEASVGTGLGYGVDAVIDAYTDELKKKKQKLK